MLSTAPLTPIVRPLWGRCLWLAVCCWSATGWAHLPTGSPAPAFALPSPDHQTSYSLGQTSQPCLLVLLRSDQRFTRETLAMSDRLTDWLAPAASPAGPGDYQPILIWVGSLAGMPEAPTSELRAPWWVAHDQDAEVAQRYSLLVSPTIYLISPERTVTQVFTGWHPLLEDQLRDAIVCSRELMTEPAGASPSGMDPPVRASLYFNLGRAMATQGLWPEALQHFQRGLDLKPEDPAALAEAARAAYVIGDWDEAQALATRALNLQTTHPLALAVMGNLQGTMTRLLLEGESATFHAATEAHPTPHPSGR